MHPLLLSSHNFLRLVDLVRHFFVLAVSHMADALLQAALMVHNLLLNGQNVGRRLSLLLEVEVGNLIVMDAAAAVRLVHCTLLGGGAEHAGARGCLVSAESSCVIRAISANHQTTGIMDPS